MDRPCLRWLLQVLILLLCGSAFGCSRCSGDSDEVLARLEAKQGRVERDFAAKPNAFESAPLKATFRVGDAARTDAGARATLSLSDGSELSLDPSSVIRFLEQPPGENVQRLDIEMGQATLNIGAKALSLQTNVGQAQIAAKSRVRLRATATGVRFDVDIGSAQFQTGGGPVSVDAGGLLELAKDGTPSPSAPSASASAAPIALSDLPVIPDTGGEGEIAVLVEGAGASSRSAAGKPFVGLPPGSSSLAPGSVVRLKGATNMTVRRGQESARLEGPGDFVIGGPDSLVRASLGGVSVGPSASRVTIKVPGGSIVVDTNSEATLRVGRTGTGVSATAGTTVIESSTGTRTLSAGEQVSLDAQGRVKVTRGRGPEVADLVIAAGDSVVVHDPKPPTAIGISISSKCTGAGIVEIMARTPVSSYGERTVNVLVAPGSSRYRVRCSDGSDQQGAVVSEGTLSVLRDSGTRQLARTPPATQVDTDGRSYTVLYQSLMPKLTVRWPHAPASAGYRLRVSSPGGKTQLVTSGGPTHTFPPGALSEGMHQLMFESDSGAKSKATALSISFDNAAPTASLTSPVEGGFAAGAQVHVSGIALPGWTVSAGGVELAQDEQHRFSGSAAAPTGQRALVIRFAHPQRGVHQYLRRSAGGP